MKRRPSTFPGKDPEERLILLLRRHRFLLFKDIFIRLILLAAVACIPILFAYSAQLPQGVASTLQKVQASGWFWLVYGLLIPVLAIGIYAAYFNWQHDLYIITDRRVVDYNWYFPFRRRNTDAPLGRVQDSNYDKTGLFANLLNYGGLFIETAAERSPFSWNGLPKPSEAQRALRNAVASYREMQTPTGAERVSGI